MIFIRPPAERQTAPVEAFMAQSVGYAYASSGNRAGTTPVGFDGTTVGINLNVDRQPNERNENNNHTAAILNIMLFYTVRESWKSVVSSECWIRISPRVRRTTVLFKCCFTCQFLLFHFWNFKLRVRSRH